MSNSISTTKADLSKLKRDIEKLVTDFSNRNPDMVPSVQVYAETSKGDNKTKVTGFTTIVSCHLEV